MELSQYEQEIVDKTPAQGIALGELLEQLSERARGALLRAKRKGLVKFKTVAGQETMVSKGGDA